ncbi:MAG: flagellar hook-associated protein FlgK [Pseudomonadales bacterium]|nr:flagellar hook-associated protein FlgK [Pseudomonadales bacterium]
MANLLGIGVSGIRASQEALTITGHNITNASTPGYSRQRVELSAQIAAASRNGFTGAGVRTDTIQRVADEYVIRQIRADQASFSEMDAFATRLEQIDSLFFSADTGLDQAMSKFFEALHSANANPASLPDRQYVLTQAEALAQRFNAVHARLVDQELNTNELLNASVERASELASSIAAVNARINALSKAREDGTANALLDQRDELLRQLAEVVQVNTTSVEGGQVNVFIGKGLPLVLGGTSSRMELDAAGDVLLRSDTSGKAEKITSSLTGGEIGGLLRFRDGALTNAAVALGNLAAGLATTVNQSHMEGLDLRGEFGGLVFRDINAPDVTRERAVAYATNIGRDTGSIDILIDDPNALTATEYDLVFSPTEPGSWLVQRAGTSEIVAQGVLSNAEQQDVTFEGVTLRFGRGDFVPGNRYALRPTRDFAGELSVVINDASRLALAAPVRLGADVDNSGSGELTLNGVDDPGNGFFNVGAGAPPLKVVFTSPTTYDVLDNSDPANPRQLDPPLRSLVYTPGVTREVLPEAGHTLVQMQGEMVGALPDTAAWGTTLDPAGNVYSAGEVAFTYVDPVTGAMIESRAAGWGPQASAQEIAHSLGSLPGVDARAVTELSITNIVTNGVDTPFEVIINGESFPEPEGLDALADAINASEALAAKGLTARSDGVRLLITDIHGQDIDIHIAGDPVDSITVADRYGHELVVGGGGPGGYKSVSMGGVVTVELDPGVTLSGNGLGLFPTAPAHVPANFGFRLAIQGRPETGDAFTASFNSEATTDNRNGLALASLASANVFGDPPISFADAYAVLVQHVGNIQNEANVHRDAASTLLDQSLATRESVSGVNLDEEAANLIQFEQAYNASAQVITVARQIFDILFDALR